MVVPVVMCQQRTVVVVVIRVPGKTAFASVVVTEIVVAVTGMNEHVFKNVSQIQYDRWRIPIVHMGVHRAGKATRRKKCATVHDRIVPIAGHENTPRGSPKIPFRHPNPVVLAAGPKSSPP
jgi:hypothetical protein